MLWFKKKNKGMIDLSSMHKKGLIKSPESNESSDVSTDSEGFVNLDSSSSTPQKTPIMGDKASSIFSFFDRASSSSSSVSSESRQTLSEDNYSKRDIDVKTEELDNKIYKLEQRIEVLERKVGIGSNW